MGTMQLGLRGFQFILATVIFGISVSLAKQQYYGEWRYGSVPFPIGLSAAAGALGIVSACLGAAALFLEAIPTAIVLGVDALAGLVLLVGALVDAVMIGGTSCTNQRKMNAKYVLNPWGDGFPGYKQMHSRCISFKADTAFMFFAAFTCVAIVATTTGFKASKFRRSGAV